MFTTARPEPFHFAVKDWPGRVKLWSVGVPPSGPMDARAFRFANALVGNAPDAAGLEFAIAGAVWIRCPSLLLSGHQVRTSRGLHPAAAL